MATQGWAHIMLPTAYKVGRQSSREDQPSPIKVKTAGREEDPISDGELSALDTFVPEGPGIETWDDGTSSWAQSDSSSYWTHHGGHKHLTHKTTYESIDEENDSDDDANKESQVAVSIGSADHGTGQCRPCAWFHKPQGCANGKDCRHCHLCPEGEIKNRKKAKVQSMRSRSSDLEAAIDEIAREDEEAAAAAAASAAAAAAASAAAAAAAAAKAAAAQAAKAESEEAAAAAAASAAAAAAASAAAASAAAAKAAAAQVTRAEAEDFLTPPDLPSGTLEFGTPPALLSDPLDLGTPPPPGLMLPEGAVPRKSAASDGGIAKMILPSPGSASHGTGACRPCAWFYKPQGCSNGKDCRHCHLCPEGEIKNRKKAKLANLKKDKDTDSEEEPPQVPLPLYNIVPMSPYDMSPVMGSMSPYGPLPYPPVPPPVFLPSYGSSLHGTGYCRPCAWFWKAQGCANGQDCYHCHLCPEGEIKERKKVKVTIMRAAEKASTPEEPSVAAVRKELSPRRVREPRASSAAEPAVAASSASALPADKDLETLFNEQREGASDGEDTCDFDDQLSMQGTSSVRSDGMPMLVPLPKSLDMASTGSALHVLGKCRPCAWHWKPQGCTNGKECAHCHLCPQGELRNRRKAKVSAMRMGSTGSQGTAGAVSSSSAEGRSGPQVVKIAPMLYDRAFIAGLAKQDAFSKAVSAGDCLFSICELFDMH